MSETNSNQGMNDNVMIVSNSEMFGLLEELLGEEKSVRIKVKGTSMLPLLHDEIDQVELSKPTVKEMVPGAIVLFRYNDAFLLHRIIYRNENKLILKGDNVFQSKEEATTDHVIGIVSKIIYPGGRELSANSFQWKTLSRCRFFIKHFYRLRLFLIKRLLF